MLAGLLAISIILGLGYKLPGIKQLNYLLYDTSLQNISRPVPSSDIVIITIDDDSLEQLGYWPWPRDVHARLLQHLRGARAVALDLILSEPHPGAPAADAELARAIEEHGKVALPAVLSPDGKHLITPIPSLQQAANSIGRIDASADSDGNLRSIQLQRTPTFTSQPQEHISISLARIAGHKPQTSTSSAEPLAIRFSTNALDYQLIPYAAVLQGKVDDAVFDNKIVLIGAWASGLGDQLRTAAGAGLMPGVEVLANSVQNVLDDSWIRIAPGWLNALLGILFVVPVCFAMGTLSARRSIGVVVLTLLGVLIGNAMLMQLAGWWLAPGGTLLAIAMAYPLWHWRSQEATLKHLDAELARLWAASPPSQPQNPTQLLDNTWIARADNLPQRAVHLQQAVNHLKQATRAQEQTLSFISHDMRSPQSAILAAIELRRGAQNQWPEDKTLDYIGQQAKATLKLVDQFVQLTRAETAPLNLHATDLYSLIQDCCDQRWAQASQRNIALHFDYDTSTDTPAFAMVDGELLARAVGNLLDNALLYSPAGSSISCRLQQQRHTWLLSVCDNGPGITAEQQKELFTRYQRGRHSSTKPAGSGLGLAFVQTVAQRHGGSASCTSTPGAGACFDISLPDINAPARI